MHILFVSSTVTGGSGKSQRQLAARLTSKGHSVQLLADDKSPKNFRRKIYEKLTDLEVKVKPLGPPGLVTSIASLMGRRSVERHIEGQQLSTSYAPENALPQLVHERRPDVVVGSSIDRVTWRKISRHCAGAGIPTVLYLREEVALGHLTISRLTPSLLLANAHSIADRARALGFNCEMVPSVVELDAVRTNSSREVALLINPIDSHGKDLGFKLAAAHPEIRFVFQESWPLSTAQIAEITGRLRSLPNVQFRERTDDPGSLYRDAKVLLVPHRIDNRPRVIAEAQSNGIPVLASDEPGLIESVGAGGRTMPADDIDAWDAQLAEVWSNAGLAAELGSAAIDHAARNELDPTWVTRRFVELLERLIAPDPSQ